jgi:hypothetical protein
MLSKHFGSGMYDVTILTETGVTGLSYGAVLWIIERALPEFPEGTLDRLDHGLDEGVMALNASDIDVISAFFYEKLDEIDDPAAREAPAVLELAAALAEWARSDAV